MVLTGAWCMVEVGCTKGQGTSSGCKESLEAPADLQALSFLPTGCTWEIPWTLLTF